MSTQGNERLNLLIRNLHLYLSRFKHNHEPDLYDHICQEVAEYFRADCCTIYRVSYKEEMDPESGMPKLTKWLELAGASGPWRRAFRQQHVRRYNRNRYQLPDAMEGESYTTSMLSGITRRGFWSDEPTRYASGCDIRPHRGETSINLREEAPQQVIWYQDKLYNSFRCSVLAPLERETRGQARGGTRESTGKSSYRKIGLIKVENRSPYGVIGFSDIAPPDGYRHLFFQEEWKITALRPFVSDLQEKADPDPFHPVHNNVVWQQYFDNHTSGAVYFQEFIRSLGQRYKPDDEAYKKVLLENYGQLSVWLVKLVECVIRLESWVQHLRYACIVICGVREKSDINKPVPSLFNVSNLTAVYLACWFEGAINLDDLNQSQNHGVDLICGQILNCLTGKSEEDKRNLHDLRIKLHIILKGEHLIEKLIEEFKEEPAKLRKETIQPIIEFFSEAQLCQLLICKQNSRYGLFFDKMAQDLQNLSAPADNLFQKLIALHQSIEILYDSLAQEIKNCIEQLCLQYVQSIRNCLWKSPDNPFNISKCLDGELPNNDGDFTGALKIVETDLKRICKSFENVKLRKQDRVIVEDREIGEELDKPELDRQQLYKLIVEETEVRYIQKTLQSILGTNHHLEQHYGVACDLALRQKNDLPREHANELERFGCKIARALAAATMNADSFNQIDEKRLAFVANLVTQVLDNYFLHQVYQRKLELDYRALDLLGLEQSGLELLDILNSYAQRLMNTLIYLVKREVFCASKNELPVEDHPFTLKNFINFIHSHIESAGEDSWIKCPLFEINFTFTQDIGTPILQKIKAVLTQEPDRINLTGDTENNTGLVFKLKNIIPNNNARDVCARMLLAYSVLQLDVFPINDHSKKDNTYRIQMFLYLKYKAVYERDLRALWSGVKTLTEILKVIQIMAGKEDNLTCP